MLERLIEEVQWLRAGDPHLPDGASAHRLVGALLAEQHEEWLTGRRYFDMSEYYGWKQKHRTEQPDESADQLLQAA